MIVEGFLGKLKDYREIISNLLKNLHVVGVDMFLNIYFPQPHLNFHHENAVSEEHDDRLHQDFKIFGDRHKCLGRNYVGRLLLVHFKRN